MLTFCPNFLGKNKEKISTETCMNFLRELITHDKLWYISNLDLSSEF